MTNMTVVLVAYCSATKHPHCNFFGLKSRLIPLCIFSLGGLSWVVLQLTLLMISLWLHWLNLGLSREAAMSLHGVLDSSLYAFSPYDSSSVRAARLFGQLSWVPSSWSSSFDVQIFVLLRAALCLLRSHRSILKMASECEHRLEMPGRAPVEYVRSPGFEPRRHKMNRDTTAQHRTLTRLVLSHIISTTHSGWRECAFPRGVKFDRLRLPSQNVLLRTSPDLKFAALTGRTRPLEKQTKF